MSALAFTAYFHIGSSLMSGSCSCSLGCSWSWTLGLPPLPQSLSNNWQVPDFSSSSAAVEVEKKKCYCAFSGPKFVLHGCDFYLRCYSPQSFLEVLSSPLGPSLPSPLWNDAGWTQGDGAGSENKTQIKKDIPLWILMNPLEGDLAPTCLSWMGGVQ